MACLSGWASKRTTVSPAWSRRRARCAPINPVPPVIMIAIDGLPPFPEPCSWDSSLVGASSGVPTARQGLHRPARGHHDDTKALFKAGRNVGRRTQTSGTGHAIFLTDSEDREQGSFDIRVGRVATQPHRHGQIPRTSPDGPDALDLAEDIRQVGDPTDV